MTPLDPERMGRNGQLAMEGAAAIGASGGPISRNAGNCVQCSSCPYGCRIDAKRGMHVSYMPRAVAAGARLRTGVEARRILVEDGRAAGVRCVAARARRAQRRPPPLHGPRPPRDDRRRRRPRHAGAAAALRPRRRPGRPQPPHPPRLLGRRPLRGGGARLGGGDAELLRRRVGARAASCSRRPSPRSPSAAPGCRARAASTRRRSSTSATSARSASSSPTSRPAGSGIARDGSIRAGYGLSDEDARRVVFGIARAAEIHFAAGATEVYPNIGRAPVLRPGRGRRVRGDPLQAVRAAPRGLPPAGNGADRRRPARGSLRRRRLGQRRRPACTSPTPPSSPPQ